MNRQLETFLRSLCCVALWSCVALYGRETSAQSLPDSLLAHLRAGAARLTLKTDSTSMKLVGSPTVPSLEVFLNGRGPFQFLVDLGSNVTVFRKNVVIAAGGRTILRRATSDIVALDSMRVGAAVFEAVVGGAYDSLDVDGVLGYNVLRNSSFTLDYPAKRFSFHGRRLPPPDNRTVIPYQVVNRMPFVWVHFGSDSLPANLDTGASEWFTIPVAYRDSIRWNKTPVSGPTVSNNQTGTRTVLSGTPRDSLRVGSLRLPPSAIYVNADADTPWLGSASMQFARWTFDPVNQRIEIVTPRRNLLR